MGVAYTYLTCCDTFLCIATPSKTPSFHHHSQNGGDGVVMKMQILVELGLDFVQMRDWGMEIYTIILTIEIMFRPRGRRSLPENIAL